MFVEEGRIRPRGKVISITAKLVSAGASAWFIPTVWVKLVVAGAAAAGSLWVAFLPTPDSTNGSRQTTADGSCE